MHVHIKIYANTSKILQESLFALADILISQKKTVDSMRNICENDFANQALECENIIASWQGYSFTVKFM